MKSEDMLSKILPVLLIGLIIYPYTKLIDHSDRILSLEKDKQYLEELFKARISNLEHNITILRGEK